MEYQPQDPVEARRIQYLSLLQGLPGVEQYTYDQLKEEVAKDPGMGKRMNDYVIIKASEQGLSNDVLTGILAAGPPIAVMLDQKIPVSYVRNELMNSTKSYYQQQLDKAMISAKPFVANAAIALHRAQDSVSVIAFSAYGNAVASFNRVVTTAQNAEKMALDSVPFGLGHFAKKGIQIAAPVVLLKAGEHLPVVGDGVKALNTAIESVSAFGSQKIGAFAQQHYLSAHMPDLPSMTTGFGSRVVNAAQSAYYQAQVFVVEQKSELVKGWAAGFSNTTFNIAASNAVVYGVKKIASLSKEGQYPFAALSRQTKSVISKSQKFIHSTQETIMSKQNGKKSELTAAQVQYMDLLKDYLPTKGMSYEQLKESHLTNSDLSFAANQFVGSAALIDGKTPAEAREIVAASPAIAADRERGTVTPDAIQHYLQEVETLLGQEKAHLDSLVDLSNKQDVPARHVDELATKIEAPLPVEISAQDQSVNQGIMATLGTTFGVDKLRNMQLDYNGETFFKMENYNQTQNVNGSPEARHAADMFQKALSDPSNVKGEVKIFIGNQPLLHVKDGVVEIGHQYVKDSSVRVEVSSPEKALYDGLSKNIKESGYTKTQKTAEMAYATGKTTEEVRSILSNDPEFSKYSKSNPELNDQMLAQANVKAQGLTKGPSVEKQREREKEAAIVA